MAEKKKADKDPEKAAPSSHKMLIIVIVILIVLLLAGGGAAAYYFLLYEKPTEAAGASEPPAPAPPAPFVYHKLEGLTVNLSSGPARFLRISLTISTQNPAVITALDKHMPMLRNDILAVLATQEFNVLNTAEGKDTLRESLRQTMVRLLARSSEPADIRDVLFNDLIMQ